MIRMNTFRAVWLVLHILPNHVSIVRNQQRPCIAECSKIDRGSPHGHLPDEISRGPQDGAESLAIHQNG